MMMTKFMYKFMKSVVPCMLLTLSIGFCYAWSLFSPLVVQAIPGSTTTTVQLAFCLNIFFLGMGVMYYLTMASLSSVGNFNELGFRLLYPGTIMAVIGISIAVAERVDVDGWLASLGSLRLFAYLLVVFAVGCNLLSAELGIRRLLGVSVYSIGEPYQQKKLKLTEKYGAEQSGSTVVLKGLGDPDFFIGCLRPDLFIEFPKGCKRY